MRGFGARARCARWKHRLRAAKGQRMSCRCGAASREMTVYEKLMDRTLEIAYYDALRPSLLIGQLRRTERVVQ